MARTKTRHLIYHQGDTFNDLEINYVDEDSLPIPITGFTVAMKIKTTDLATTVVTLDSSGIGGIVVMSPTLGFIEFAATPAQMAGLTPGVGYRYDVQITDGIVVETLLRGIFKVDSEVTDG